MPDGSAKMAALPMCLCAQAPQPKTNDPEVTKRMVVIPIFLSVLISIKILEMLWAACKKFRCAFYNFFLKRFKEWHVLQSHINFDFLILSYYTGIVYFCKSHVKNHHSEPLSFPKEDLVIFSKNTLERNSCRVHAAAGLYFFS